MRDHSDDPHPEWKRRRLEVRDRLNSGESDDPDVCAEAARLEDLIADTPARTFAGVATQIWLAANGIEEFLGANPGGHEHRSLLNALAALERLADGELGGG